MLGIKQDCRLCQAKHFIKQTNIALTKGSIIAIIKKLICSLKGEGR